METPASCATFLVLPRRLASAPRYCLHCFSLSMVRIWWYSCSIDNFSILPMLASFPHCCQVIYGSLLRAQCYVILALDGLQPRFGRRFLMARKQARLRASHQVTLEPV